MNPLGNPPGSGRLDHDNDNENEAETEKHCSENLPDDLPDDNASPILFSPKKAKTNTTFAESEQDIITHAIECHPVVDNKTLGDVIFADDGENLNDKASESTISDRNPPSINHATAVLVTSSSTAEDLID